jgi:succinyl-diaminopimelate desuccinylase
MTRTGLAANDGLHRNVRSYLESQRQAQTRFLAELVKAPSDNPPGDCARRAERAAELLGELGLVVERHKVPKTLVRSSGMISVTNLIVRTRFGDGPHRGAQRPRRRSASRRRLD